MKRHVLRRSRLKAAFSFWLGENAAENGAPTSSLSLPHCYATFRDQSLKQVRYSCFGIPGSIGTRNPRPHCGFKLPACADPTDPIVCNNPVGLYSLKASENILMEVQIHRLLVVRRRPCCNLPVEECLTFPRRDNFSRTSDVFRRP